MPIIHVKSNTVADFTGTVTVGNSAGATTTIAATDLVRPSDWNSNHSVVYTLGGNTSVNSTAGATDVQIHGSGNITVAGSTGTLVISGPGWSTLNNWAFGPQYDPSAQGSATLTNNSIWVYPVNLTQYVSGQGVRIPVQFSHGSSGASSGQKGVTIHWGVYTRNVSTLSLLYSTTYTMAASYSSNASMMNSYITAIGNSTSYNSTTTSSAGINISSLLHGGRELILPFSTTLPPGEYFIAQKWSTSGAGTTGSMMQMSQIMASNNTFNRVGIGVNTTNPSWQKLLPAGVFSTTSAGLPNSMATADVHNHGHFYICYWAALTA